MRSEIAQALLDYLSPITWGDPVRGFAYKSPRMRSWADVPAQPALLIQQGDEQYQSRTGLPPIRDLEFQVFTYQNVGLDTSVARPADENDLILEAIERRLEAYDTPDGRQTLGGLVHHARINGTIGKDGGDDDGQGMLIVPVWVMIP